MNRLHWLDTAKGLGITAVVAGHVFSSRQIVDPIFLWHMPRFFFLSGHLFSPRPALAFALQKARHLLVPYLAFLIVLSLPALVSGDVKHLMRMAFGGRTLGGAYGTFWFVPVLFVTQQLANLALPRLSPAAQAASAAACLAVALLLPPHLMVPWALDVVLVALPIFWVGTRLKAHAFDRAGGLWISVLGLASIALCAAGLLPPIDMKNGVYGWPGVSLLTAMAGVHLVCHLSHWRLPLTGAWQALGRASMTIMFVHPALFMVLRDDLKLVTHEGVLFAMALGVPFALHHLMTRTALTRRLFLGETPQPLRGPAPPTAQSRQSV